MQPEKARKLPRQRMYAALVFVLALACVAQDSHPSDNSANKTVTTPVASQANSQNQQITSAENERKKQIADESARLLTMALALKAEVDKTSKDTLSINVIRKADEIEKLARTVKEKMKQNGAS
jgi:nitric oxide reductase activation protein